MASLGTTSRKRKRDELLFADQEIATVHVEDRHQIPRQFHVHKHLLCSSSEVLREHFDRQDTRVPVIREFFDIRDAKVMRLKDVRPEDFELFCRWLYTKALDMEEIEDGVDDGHKATSGHLCSVHQQFCVKVEKTNGDGGSDSGTGQTGHGQHLRIPFIAGGDSGDPTIDNKPWYTNFSKQSRTLARLLGLYIFAEVYKADSFKVAVMLEFQRSAFHSDIPAVNIVRHALDHLGIDSGMCSYLLDRYGSQDFSCPERADEAKLEKALYKLPSRFLTRMISLVARRTAGGTVNGKGDRWCDYHEHKSEEERKECEDSRPQDVDVVRKGLERLDD
ncbi:hypothetical protein A1O7_01405 [Cladophialophora yegresii CBS 114405]|uniref:BTB domain-containing protein n=1 Tax=Cladophialophora yegresii CBS 114405 TaxID=1182544 RepID=W9WJB6_9EURO|nr:uncharacterized protein A1O7_01405 [Cladophialophora yegresii CBS 114405]EXJ65065.1 hypothetical protein A1O7_01405 [Cladophialophora yegresii CBS 114405]